MKSSSHTIVLLFMFVIFLACQEVCPAPGRHSGETVDHKHKYDDHDDVDNEGLHLVNQKHHGEKHSKECDSKEREVLYPVDWHTLSVILEFMQNQGVGITGDFVFSGQLYSVDFIFTVLGLYGLDITEINKYQLWDIMSYYRTYYGPKMNKMAVIEYFINFLWQNPSSYPSVIYFQGQRIPLDTIFLQIIKEGLMLEYATPQMIFGLLQNYVGNESGSLDSGDPLGPNPTFDQQCMLNITVNFLKTQNSDVTLTFTFSRHRIPVHDFFVYYKEREEELSSLSPDLLYAFIFNYIHNKGIPKKTDQNPPQHEIPRLQTILEYLKIASQETAGSINYDGIPVPISFILTSLSLKGIPVNTADVNELGLVLSEFKNYTENYPHTNSDYLELKLVMDTLDRDGNKARGNIIYNGHLISIQSIVEDINKKDTNIQISKLQLIIDAMDSEIYKQTTTTKNYKPIGEQPTQNQSKQLKRITDFLRLEGKNFTGTIPFDGYNIPYNVILEGMKKLKKGIDQLEPQQLYKIIFAFVRGDQQTTTEAYQGLQLPPDEINSLQECLKKLITQGSNATGNLTIAGHVIPYSYIDNVIKTYNIDINQVTIDKLYKIALTYLEKEKNLPPTEKNISGIPEDKVISVIFLLDYLKSGNSSDIVFDGKTIPKEYILNTLRILNVDVKKLNPADLYNILQIYEHSIPDRSTIDNLKLSQESKEILQKLLEALKSQGDSIQGEIVINGYSIPLQKVLQIIKLNKVNIQNISSEYLFRIILALSEGQQGSPNTDEKTTIYNMIIQALQTPSSTNTTYIISINGKEIPLDYFVREFKLRKDSSGAYNTSGLTIDHVYKAFGGYYKRDSVQILDYRKVLLQNFKKVLDKEDRTNEMWIQFNGKSIPMQYLEGVLHLKKDTSTGKYKIDGVTAEQLLDALNGYEAKPTHS